MPGRCAGKCLLIRVLSDLFDKWYIFDKSAWELVRIGLY